MPGAAKAQFIKESSILGNTGSMSAPTVGLRPERPEATTIPEPPV
jgi:hypothetical protein